MNLANALLGKLQKTMHFRTPAIASNMELDGRPTTDYFKWYITSIKTLKSRYEDVLKQC